MLTTLRIQFVETARILRGLVAVQNCLSLQKLPDRIVECDLAQVFLRRLLRLEVGQSQVVQREFCHASLRRVLLSHPRLGAMFLPRPAWRP